MFSNSIHIALFCVLFILFCPIEEHMITGSLIVTGDQKSDSENGAEFGSVQQTGGLISARYNHTITLLEDGKVLAVGGTSDGSGSLRSTEVFDPDTGEWTRTSELSTGRMRHTATLLDSGKVLIVGGYIGDGTGSPSLWKHFNGTGNISLSTCEVYDPVNDSVSPVPGLITGRFWHRAVKLNDGRVLVMGGLNVSNGALSSCEIFDQELEEWKEISPLRVPKVRFTATVLENGSVLTTGGHDGVTKDPFPWCEIYVPENDTWYDVASMNKARGYHTGIIMNDGRVLVSGGFSSSGKQDWNDSEIYDPELDRWSESGSMSLPRHNHEMIQVENGEVLMFGGSNCLTGQGHSGIEYYDPELGEWDHTNLVIMGLKWTAAILMKDGNVLVCGGRICNDPSNISYIYSSQVQDGDKEDSTRFLPGFQSSPMVIVILMTMSILMKRREIMEHCGKRSVPLIYLENGKASLYYSGKRETLFNYGEETIKGFRR